MAMAIVDLIAIVDFITIVSRRFQMRTFLHLVLVCLSLSVPGMAVHCAVINVPGDQPTINEGIDAAVDGDTVIVADGTYTGTNNRNLDFNGKAITVRSENGLNGCVLDCENEGYGFIFQTGEDSQSVLAGLTIINGNNYQGAGICIRSASPRIKNCKISSCHASDSAGGIYIQNGSPYISGCTIDNNANDYYSGGGIRIESGGCPVVEDCQIQNNSAGWYGGGISVISADIFIVNCVISGNTVTDYCGGGICFESAQGTIVNCLFDSNSTSSNSGGGGFAAWSNCNVELVNCTFTGNSGMDKGGAIYMAVSNVSADNCILWNNSNEEIYVYSGDLQITYSDVFQETGVYPGEGNINHDPLFVSGPLGDYYLSQIAAGQGSDSPCVDACLDRAGDLRFEFLDTAIRIGDLSTRTDEKPDMGIADMGYHYPSIFKCSELGCRIYMPSDDFGSGDVCFCDVYIGNPGMETYDDIPLFVILDVYGVYFFAPGFTDFDQYTIDVEPGLIVCEVLPPFTWPNAGSSAEGLYWYAAMTDPDITELFGAMGTFEFRYH